MSKNIKAADRAGGVGGLLARAERFAVGSVLGLGRVGGWTAAFSSSLVAAVCAPALAGPEGARVVRGNVSISRTGADTVIRASHNSIINYRSFDIGRGESVRFLQPNASSRVLNRIDSRLPTRIDGTLTANGRVYLINPNGVLFGQGSIINVNQLYAAAGNLSDKDFVRGIDRFTNLKGEVSNFGSLTADFVGLAGANTTNSGQIVAPQGTVVMASGKEVLIGERTGNVFVKITGEAAAAPAGHGATENTGTIDARGGRVTMGAGDVFSIAVRQAGAVKAKNVRVEGTGAGEVHVTGSIDASNASGKGGEVRVLGEKVGLGGATIDASGRDGGGKVLVGGNFQGQGRERNAEQTYVSGGSVIKADATQRGDGGTVVVWGDQTTRYYGDVSARGGEQGGDGGFVEVSGKINLGFDGGVDTRAPHGKTGMLLLDPLNITVQNTGSDDGQLSDDQILFADGGASSFTISDEALEARTSNITLQATNDITFAQSVDMPVTANGVSITCRAGDDINVNAGVTITTRGGDLIFTANDPGGSQTDNGAIVLDGNLDTTAGNQSGGDVTLTVSGGTGVITLNGDITTRDGVVTFAAPVVMGGDQAIDTTQTGAVTGASVNFNSTLNGGGVGTDDLTIRAGTTGNITITGATGATTRLGHLTVTSANNVTTGAMTASRITQAAGSGTTTFGAINTDNAGGVSLTGAAFTLGTVTSTSNGGFTVSNSGTLTLNGLLNIQGTFLQSGGGATNLNAGITTTNDDITFTNSVAVGATTELIAGTGIIAVATTSIGGGFTLTLTGDEVNLTGAANSITGPGGLVIRPSSANEELRVSTAAGVGRLDITDTELLTVASSVSGLTLGSTTTGNINWNNDAVSNVALTLTSGADININADVTAPSITATADDNVTVANATTRLLASTGTLRLQAAADGSGTLALADATYDANTMEFVSGDGAAGTNTGSVNATAGPAVFRGAAGAGTSPTSFTLQQDAAIADAAIPAAAQFDGGIVGMGYTIDSDSSTVTLSTASKVADAALVINAATTATLSTNIAPFGVTFNATTVNLNGDINTSGTGAGAAIQINGNVVLATDVDLTTIGAAAGAAVGITGTVEGTTAGTEDLIINAGTGGAVTLGGNVGGTTRLGTMQITNGGTVSAAGLRATTVTSTTGTSGTFNGAINATTGGVTLTSTTLNLNNSITTSGTAVDINGAVILGADVTVDTTNAGGSAAGAGVDFSSTVNGTTSGTEDLIINGGTGGAVVLNGAVGGTTRLGTMQVTNGASLTAAGLRATTITTTSVGTSTFNGALNATSGGVTLTGATINLNNNITTSGSAVDVNGAVVLGADVTVDTTNAGGSVAGAGVDFSSTINGTTDVTEDLFINAGTGGVVALNGAVGATTRLNTMQVTNGGSLTASGLRAATISSTAVGTSTFNGAINATTGGVSLSSGTINLNNNITTSGTAISLTGPVTLGADVSVDSTNAGGSAAGATVSFSTTVAGSGRDLTVNGGTGGAVSFGGAVGGGGALDVFTITNGLSASTVAVTATQIAATVQGTGTFGGLLTSGAGGTSLSGATINANAGATSTGSMTVTAGTAFNASGGNITAATGFTKNGAGLSTFGIDISTTNAAINFTAGSILFSGNSTLTAGTGTITTQAADINGRTITMLANAFSFAGGANSITGTGAGSLRLGGATDATTIGVAGGSGTSQVESADLAAFADEAFGSLTIGRAAQSGAITVGASTYHDAVTFSTTGTVTTTGQVDGDQTDANVTFAGSTVTLGAGVTTTDGDITVNGNTVLSASVTLDTTVAASPGGNISLNGTVDGTAGGAAEDLSLVAGTAGAITITGATGGSESLGTFLITSGLGASTGSVTAATIDVTTETAGTTTFGGLLTADAGGITLVGGTVNLNGGATTTNNGFFDITSSNTFTVGAVALNLDGFFTKSGAGTCVFAGNLSTTNDNITLNSAATIGAANVTLTAGTATIDFNSTLGVGGNNLTLLADGIDFGAANSVSGTGAGTLRLGGATDATTIGLGGAAGTLQIDAVDLAALADEAAGSIIFGRAAQSGNISVAASTFRDATTFSSTGTVASTGAVVGSQGDSSLTFTGGLIDIGGDVTTNGAIIQLNGPVTISANMTFDTTNAGGAALGANITATGAMNSLTPGSNTVAFTAGTDGDVSLQTVGATNSMAAFTVNSGDEFTAGAITSGTISVTVDNAATYSGLLTTSNVGGVTLAGAGSHTLDAGATTTGGGTFSATSAGALNVNNTALSLDGAFLRDGGVTNLGQNITTTNDNITFTDGDDDVTLTSGPRTLAAGTGTISFGGNFAVGANTTTLRGNGIDFTGGANSVTGTGAATLTLVGATNATTIGVGTGAGTLNLSQTDISAIADGAFAFVDIGAAAGTGTVDIGAISLRDPTRFLAGGVGGVVSTSGVVTGTTADANLTFSGTSNSITSVNTLGSVTITGTNNAAGGVAGSSISITGAVNNIGGDLVTPGGTITITGPVTLTATSLWDSTNAGAVAAGANITATSTIDGGFDLSFRAGTAGDISVAGAVGFTTRLGDITVVSVANTTADFDANVFAATFTQNAGSSNFDGVLNTNGAGGISLTGSTFTFNAGVTTTGGGGITIVNTGLLTIASAAFSLDGAFAKSGAGATSLGANITTTNDAISFGGGTTTLTAGILLNTGAGAGDVTFNSQLTGAQTLGITAGTGAVAFNAQVGSTALTSLTVTSSGSVAALSTIDTVGITSFTSAGNVSLANLVTTGGTFSSTGLGFTMLGGITTSNDAVSINHTGAVSNGGAIVAGTGTITITGSTIAQNSTAGGSSYSATATGNIDVADDITAATINVHAGTSGTGNLAFTASGVELSGTTITLRAGDGTGGAGVTGTADLVTNSPTFLGLAGLGTSPTTFTHRQDADITDSLMAAASQFGNGIVGMNYTLQSDDGSVFITDGSKVAGSILTVSGNGTGDCVDFGADISLDSLTVNSAWCVSANITIETTNGTLALLGTGQTFANNVVFSGNEIDLGAAVTGTGRLTFRTFAAGDDILFGGAGSTAALDMTATELGFLADGFASVTLGRADGTGAINSGGALTVLDPFTFLTDPTGAIQIDHTVRGNGNATLTFSGPTTLTASVITQANAIVFNDDVTIGGADILIDSTDGGGFVGGVVVFQDVVDADLAANARSLTVRVDDSSATFFDDVGATQALESLTVTGNTSATSILLRGVSTRAAQTYNGNTALQGDLSSTVGGTITVNGQTVLESDATITTAGAAAGDQIEFTGAVNGDGNGPWNLTTDSGIARTRFLGDVGLVNPLATLDATASQITVFDVTTSGGQVYNGSLFVNGNLNGQAVTVNGGTEIDADSVITGTTLVNFNGTVISMAGLARTLTVNSPTTTFGGLVGGIASGELGSLTTDAAGTTTFAGGGVTTVNGQTYADNVLLGAATTFTSLSLGDIAFVGTVGSEDATARALTVNTGGGSIFRSAVGGANQLASLTTDSTGFTLLTANVTTSGAQSYGDNVLLDGNVVANAGSATFSGEVNSNDLINARSLTVNASGGAISFVGPVGGTAVLSSLQATGSTVSLHSVTTTGAQAYTGAAMLDGDLESTLAGTISVTGNLLVAGASSIQTAGAAADDITVTGTINSSGTAQDLVINARPTTLVVGGDVTLSGASGLILALQNLTVTANTISLQEVRSTAAQTYTGASTLGGNLTSTGIGAITLDGPTVLAANLTVASTDGNILFNNILDSDTTQRILTVNVGGASRNARFGGAVGGLRALNSLTVTDAGAGAIILAGTGVSTSNDQVYNGRVQLAADVTIAGNDITFGGAVDSDSSATMRALTVNSATVSGVGGVTRFNGIVGEGARLRTLTTNADGRTRFGSNVRTNDGMTIADALEIGGDSVVDGGSGQMLFRSTINAASDASLPRLFLHSTFTSTASAQPMRFGGSIGTTGIFRGVFINAGSGFVARTSPQKAATAVFADAFNADGTINASTVSSSDAFSIVAGNEGFTMGTGEKLTVLGTLRLVGSGASNSQVAIPGQVNLGDITALGDIVVRANTIRFVPRGSGTVFEKQVVNNAVAANAPIIESSDIGRTDLVAGGAFDFVGSLDTGQRDAVIFSNTSGLLTGALGAGGFSIRNFAEGGDGVSNGVTVDLFRNPANTAQLFGLDLRARGTAGTSIATSIAGAIPRDSETREVATPVTVGRALREQLEEMGVFVRDLTFEEMVEFLVGWSTYRDLPENPLQSGRNIVTINRLQSQTVGSAVEAYRALMYAPVIGADGQVVLDDQGQPQIAKRQNEIRDALGMAWESYAAASTEQTGAGFRAYLEGRGEEATQDEKDALTYLNGAREVFDRIDAMGMSPKESTFPKVRLIGDILPPAMTEDQLKEAVYGNQLAMF
ncbi:Heme/hemopexin-binding protein [Phycisphaerales bacterium]|nr:Heme/hemopexin-binding protein [Phycisphaerales bacterium]